MSKMSKTIAALGVVAGLGVAALPLASYAATTADVTINALIEDTLSIAVDQSTVALGAVDAGVMNGGPVVEGSTNVTVITNDTDGYTVNIKDADEVLNLVSGSDTIAPGVPTQGNSAWGYKGGDVSNYTAITAADVALKTTSDPTTTDGDKFALTFGVTADASQAAGTYTDTVTLTVVAN